MTPCFQVAVVNQLATYQLSGNRPLNPYKRQEHAFRDLPRNCSTILGLLQTMVSYIQIYTFIFEPFSKNIMGLCKHRSTYSNREGKVR